MVVKVNTTCIGCGLCMNYAPTIFKVEGIPAKVIKQPENPEEQSACATAIENCPVKAISDEAKSIKMDDAPMTMAA